MTPTADVVVVGGGVMGASIAYHVAAAGAGRVLLLERESALGTGSTGRCAGGFRIQFTSEINVRLSLASVPRIRGFSAEHGLPLDVHADGYLFLVRDEGAWAAHRAAAAMQRGLGGRVEELSPAEAARLVPGLVVEGVIGATYGPDDGITDPSGLTNGYATLARRAGVEIQLGQEVIAISTTADGSTVTGVETIAGPVRAPRVVVAAGVWSRALAMTCGLDLPVVPEPRHVVTTTGFEGRPERRTLVIDTATMAYFHREGPGLLMGMPRLSDRISTFATDVDEAWIADELLPAELALLPALEGAGLLRSWVGLYEMTPDHHPILGPVAGLDGMTLATGFSGHGFQHAPAVGEIVAAQLAGTDPPVDVSTLALERFAAGRLIGEAHVV